MYGFDGSKLVKRRKRQTIVDSLGLLLKVVVSEGNAPERVLTAYALMELLEEHPEILEKVEVMCRANASKVYLVTTEIENQGTSNK